MIVSLPTASSLSIFQKCSWLLMPHPSTDQYGTGAKYSGRGRRRNNINIHENPTMELVLGMVSSVGCQKEPGMNANVFIQYRQKILHVKITRSYTVFWIKNKEKNISAKSISRSFLPLFLFCFLKLLHWKHLGSLCSSTVPHNLV